MGNSVERVRPEPLDVNNLSTKLRLHLTSQYAYTQPASNLMTLTLGTLPTFIAQNITIGTSAESLDIGIAVYLDSLDQNWHYGYSESANGGLIGGITLSSADINASIQIFTGGTIAVDGIAGFDGWNWQPGTNEGLFVRAKKGITTGLNISQDELTSIDGTEDFYMKIGYPIEKQKVNLDFSEQWKFED